MCSRVTFVNFTVTRSSLQSQCLHRVLKAERPDIDTKRSDLLKLQGFLSFHIIIIYYKILCSLIYVLELKFIRRLIFFIDSRRISLAVTSTGEIVATSSQ